MSESIDRERFELLMDVCAMINSDYSDGRSLIARIIESSTRLVAAQAASLVLFDPSTDKLRFEVATGPAGSRLSGTVLEPGEGIAGWVAGNGKSIVVNDPDRDPRFSPLVAKSVDFPARSILAVPLKVRGSLLGVIEAVNKESGRYFVEEDLRWMERLATQAAIALENARLLEKTASELNYQSQKAQEAAGWHLLIGESNLIREKIELVDRIADSEVSVLISGESGVGKELFAERIHRGSRRADKPFVRVNCAALPENLLESELFGHVRGAFTDAYQDRKGRFELAEGGTIFLDEIGELPLRLQAKLLRVLQQKTYEPVGSSIARTANVRVLAASNRDLEAMTARQEFRSDLYYRLNVLPLVIPPLRERKEDIPVLARHFLAIAARETKKSIRGFTDAALDLMMEYAWPGNVRELENAVERAAVITRQGLITPADLMIGGAAPARDLPDSGSGEKSLKQAMNEFKAAFLRQRLEMHGWNQTETARALRIQRTYLSRLIKELTIMAPKE